MNPYGMLLNKVVLRPFKKFRGVVVKCSKSLQVLIDHWYLSQVHVKHIIVLPCTFVILYVHCIDVVSFGLLASELLLLSSSVCMQRQISLPIGM